MSLAFGPLYAATVYAESLAKIPACSPQTMAQILGVEEIVKNCPQVDLSTEHVLHGGMYARTIRLGPNVLLTGALVKIPTMVIINGHADVVIGDRWAEVRGYGVIPASSGRKQVYVTLSPVEITMIFPTQAKTVEEAEREFTDDADRLMSRRSTKDVVMVTGE